MSSEFGDKLASLGCHGRFPSNIERVLIRYISKIFGVNFNLYYVSSFVKSMLEVATPAEIGCLLPQEVAHWLWRFSPRRFAELFSLDRLNRFWAITIERDEEWFRMHPLREQIVNAPDRSKFLPIHFFGDDGTLRKTRVMKTMTWFSALETHLCALHSRIPCYVLPRHIVLKDKTENDMQETMVWAMDVWATGKFYYHDSTGSD